MSSWGPGVPPPTPSWGGMLNESILGNRLLSAPWLGTFPAIALALAVFSFSLLGNAVRDALDRRLKRNAA